jgi:hypothetical protein
LNIGAYAGEIVTQSHESSLSSCQIRLIIY